MTLHLLHGICHRLRGDQVSHDARPAAEPEERDRQNRPQGQNQRRGPRMGPDPNGGASPQGSQSAVPSPGQLAPEEGVGARRYCPR